MERIDKNIVLIGMPGCGKSSIGKKLAEILKLEFLDVDVYIEEKWNMSIPEIFEKGEACFRQIETRALEEVSAEAPRVISTGGGIVKDYRNIEILRKNSVIIYINRPIEAIAGDIDIENRPLLAEGRERVYSLYAERRQLYEDYSDMEIQNDESEDEAVLKIIRSL